MKAMDAAQTTEVKDDKAVISSVLDGESDRYAAIVRKYNGYLYKIGRSYGFNHADTEDLMQETYVNAYENLSQFENRAAFKTWITRIMLNECYHKKHRARFQQEQNFSDTYSEEDMPSKFTDYNNSTDEKVENNELGYFLEKAILNIPKDYRMVFTLRELNGLDVRETSKALDITESNVKVKLYRARHMLQDEILKVYNPEDLFDFNLIYCEPMVKRVMQAIEGIEC
jgi:RNA polymerase sigma-70 factor (ECF subfamily)